MYMFSVELANSIRQQAPQKRWHLLTNLYDVTSLKTRMFISTEEWHSNLLFYGKYCHA